MGAHPLRSSDWGRSRSSPWGRGAAVQGKDCAGAVQAMQEVSYSQHCVPTTPICTQTCMWTYIHADTMNHIHICKHIFTKGQTYGLGSQTESQDTEMCGQRHRTWLPCVHTQTHMDTYPDTAPLNMYRHFWAHRLRHTYRCIRMVKFINPERTSRCPGTLCIKEMAFIVAAKMPGE